MCFVYMNYDILHVYIKYYICIRYYKDHTVTVAEAIMFTVQFIFSPSSLYGQWILLRNETCHFQIQSLKSKCDFSMLLSSSALANEVCSTYM